MKTIDEKIKELTKRLALLDPELAILFGSAARGDSRPTSDLDVIVVMKTNKRFMDRLHEAYETLDLDFHFDMLVYTPEEFEELRVKRAFVRKAVREGKVIYEKRRP